MSTMFQVDLISTLLKTTLTLNLPEVGKTNKQTGEQIEKKLMLLKLLMFK